MLALAAPAVLVLYQTDKIDTASVILVACLSVSAFGHRLDRHAAQGASRRAGLANQRFRDAFENLGQGLTSVNDHENKLVICNRRYHEIYGLDPEIVRPGIELRAIASILFADKLHDVDFEQRTARF